MAPASPFALPLPAKSWLDAIKTDTTNNTITTYMKRLLFLIGNLLDSFLKEIDTVMPKYPFCWLYAGTSR
jgi:hypothetical protein